MGGVYIAQVLIPFHTYHVPTPFQLPFSLPNFRHAFPHTVHTKAAIMKSKFEHLKNRSAETHEGFHLGATVAVLLLFLAFMLATLYIGMDILS